MTKSHRLGLLKNGGDSTDKIEKHVEEAKKSSKDIEEGRMTVPGLPNKLCLVLEYCPRGSLFDCLIKRREKVDVNRRYTLPSVLTVYC